MFIYIFIYLYLFIYIYIFLYIYIYTYIFLKTWIWSPQYAEYSLQNSIRPTHVFWGGGVSWLVGWLVFAIERSLHGNPCKSHQATIAESTVVSKIAFLVSLSALASPLSLPRGQGFYAATLWFPKPPFFQAYCFRSRWGVITACTFLHSDHTRPRAILTCAVHLDPSVFL